MKAFTTAMLLVWLSVVWTGCQKNADQSSLSTEVPHPDAEIRAAIQAHLAHKGTLNVQAFDTDVKQVAIQNDRAQAQVEFRVKNGPGSMELTYELEKHHGTWAVVETNPLGSNFSHPALDQVPNPDSGAPVGGNHSLADTLKGFKSDFGGASQSLPRGHPPVNSRPGP